VTRRHRSQWIRTLLVVALPTLASASEPVTVQLDVKPKICTLAAGDDQCETTVRANWKSARDESLCLVIAGRPEIKRCWEQYSQGNYRVELAFNQDLIVQLKDPQLENVIASTAITIIREALQLRRKRRQPWNILY
jgi:Protein of unknown function (DUF3019)